MLEGLISERMQQLNVHQQPRPHRELHSLCLQQEKIVINQVCRSPSFDIYRQIAHVCPTQADLRDISNDQVATRIHFHNNTTSENHISYSKFNNSPEEEEADHQEDVEHQLEGFGTFSQPSIRNFLDQVDAEESSLWNNREYFPE